MEGGGELEEGFLTNIIGVFSQASSDSGAGKYSSGRDGQPEIFWIVVAQQQHFLPLIINNIELYKSQKKFLNEADPVPVDLEPNLAIRYQKLEARMVPFCEALTLSGGRGEASGI